MTPLRPVEVWTCPECEWSGTEDELAGDYYGTLDAPTSARHCNTVCPVCGEWLNAKANRKVELRTPPAALMTPGRLVP